MNIITKIRGKIAYWKRGILLYGTTSLKPAAPCVDIDFLVIDSMESFSALNSNIASADYEIRFKAGHLFCCLMQEEHIASYGWVNPTGIHSLGELNLEMNLKNGTEVLYDFFTFPQYRGYGNYPVILRKISDRNLFPKVIYVLENNTASTRGIEKAEFMKLGKITGLNKMNYSHLIAALWEG